jgi:thiamine biosynthesis lipoprotein
VVSERNVRRESPAEPVLPSPRNPRYQATGWNALGSQVNLMVADGSRLTDAGTLSRRLLDRIDRSCSRHRADADLVRANQAAGRWVRVDPLLAAVVQSAVRVAKGTSGLVDPAMEGHLPALRRPAQATPATPGAPMVGTPLSGAWEEIEVDPEGGLKVPAGAQLDLGGMDRAVAADSIAKRVSAEAGTSLVVCIGGDIAVGNLPGEQHRWRLSVNEQPDDERCPAVNVVLAEGALSTASTRAWRFQPSQTRAHLHRDPRTGMPVTPIWRTASVCAATCVDASAASAAAIVLGEQAPAWLWQRSLAARLVTPSGRVLRIAGWPED